MVAVERELHEVDPTAIENPKTLEQIRDDSLASLIFAMQLLVGFAVVGSMLTLVESTASLRCRSPRDTVSWRFAWRLVLNKRTFGISFSAKDFV
jgi:hypothetical protein